MATAVQVWAGWWCELDAESWSPGSDPFQVEALVLSAWPCHPTPWLTQPHTLLIKLLRGPDRNPQVGCWGLTPAEASAHTPRTSRCHKMVLHSGESETPARWWAHTTTHTCDPPRPLLTAGSPRTHILPTGSPCQGLDPPGLVRTTSTRVLSSPATPGPQCPGQAHSRATAQRPFQSMG